MGKTIDPLQVVRKAAHELRDELDRLTPEQQVIFERLHGDLAEFKAVLSRLETLGQDEKPDV